MTFQHKETAQQDQTIASEYQNNGRSEINVTFLPVAHTQASVLENIKQVRERISREVLEFDQNDLPQNLQTEIPKLAVLLQRIERLALETTRHKKLSSLSSLVSSLEVALASLFQKKLSKEFTRQIRLDVERQIIREEQLPIFRPIANQLFYIWHSKSVRLSVIYGLAWSFIVMFGGLSSLALFQYAVYNSDADSRTIDALIEKENKKLVQLTTQVDDSTIPKVVSQAPTDTNGIKSGKEDIEPAAASAKQAVQEGRIINTKNRITDTKNKIAELDERLTKIKEKRSPLQNFLTGIDIGFSKTLSLMLWVAAAGTLGSIVSILIRVSGESYDKKAYDDRLTPFFIGFFKPVIGASFGILFLAFLSSGVISTPFITESNKASNTSQGTKDSNDSETKTAFFLFSVAFVVGFSERLAKDTISKLEGSSSEVREYSKESNSRVAVVRFRKPINRNNRTQSSLENNEADT